MVVGEFAWTRTPRIIFGAGTLARLSEIVGVFGRNVVLLTGAHSLKQSDKLDQVLSMLAQAGSQCRTYTVCREPSPELVNDIVTDLRGRESAVVVAIGGGSVIDAGKAVSAMLPQEHPVEAFLENVGTLAHDGRKVPFVAVPTTAGTGSEATVNAVLGRVGHDGYKASLRHPNLAPDVALVDLELTLSCPPAVTAASGLDALTQLLEAFVSTRSSPMTDDLARGGLIAAHEHLLQACRAGQSDLPARTGMAYASLMSGLVLANVGLGVVHGLAGVIGGLCDAPHGVICGTLLAAATRRNIEKLRQIGGPALHKYAAVGRLFGADTDDVDDCCGTLIETLAGWVAQLELPRLGDYGLDASRLSEIADRASNKNSPVTLDRTDMTALLHERM
ncbi:MAG: iron-containing alcohol dehydrogenase [Phycisphaerae bacterium]|jgi:alcohol dehydrogenase class IV